MTQSNTATNTISEEASQATKNILSQHQQLKEGCSIIGYDIRNWSGKKTFSEGKVTAIDNTGNDVELPTDLVSPGRKSLLDTKTHLSFCNKYASRMSRLFNKYGIKFLGNYLIADALLPELLREAETDIAAYEVEVEAFCAKYEQLIAEWCVKHPGLESVIRDGYMSVNEVRARFRLRIYKPVRFSPRVEEDLADIVGEASYQLFEDISKEAQSLLKESLTIKDGGAKGSLKEECTQDIKRPLRRLRDKIFSLYMLDPLFEGVVDIFDDLLDRALPDTGKIRGEHFRVLMSHVMMMTDSHKLQLHASGINQIAAKVASFDEPEVDEVVEPVVASFDEPEVDEVVEPVVDEVDEDDEEAQLLAQLEKIRRQKQQAAAEKAAAEKAAAEKAAAEKAAAEKAAAEKAAAEKAAAEKAAAEKAAAEMDSAEMDSAELVIDDSSVVLDEALTYEAEAAFDISTQDYSDAPKPKVKPSAKVTTSGFFF